MKSINLLKRITLLALLFGFALGVSAVQPPVVRSTEYNGSYSNIVTFAAAPWMSASTTVISVEGWVYCRTLTGEQAFIARHRTNNLYFGATGNKLRFFRSGGTFADSDGTLVPNRWTHVAVSYDGTTARFYINGVGAGVKGLANTGNTSTNSLSLGGQHDLQNLADVFSSGYPFSGYLDEIRLWTTVRSQTEIASNMNIEVRSGAGLLATFGNGGEVNELRPGTGTTQGIVSLNRHSGFGMQPSELCIPYTDKPLTLDGKIDLLNEYRGAETIVLRSTVNTTTPDHKGYLMVSTNTTNSHLYVALENLDSASLPAIPVVQIAGTLNATNGSTPDLGDWECRLSQDQFQGGTIYDVNPPFFPKPSWLSWGQGRLDWQATNRVPLEFNYDYEFRIHSRHLNSFTNSVGLLFRYFGFKGAEQWVAPVGGTTNNPSTYARANWCGRADSAFVPVSLSGVVSNITTHGNQAGWTVTLRSGLSPLSGTVIRSIPVTDSGSFTISGDVPPEVPFHLILEYRDRYTFLPPEVLGSFGQAPSAISANSVLTYTPCQGSCSYRGVRFVVQSPPGPLALTSVTPERLPGPVLVRTNPRKTTPATSITLTGANLHEHVRVFFKGSGCNLLPPTLCPNDFTEATVLSTTLDRTSLVVAVPEYRDTASSEHTFQIVVQNPDYLQTGGSQLTYGPNVAVTPPPYAQLYGFEFPNTDGFPTFEEFEASYGDSIWLRDPLFGFIVEPRIRDPYYLFYSSVYLVWMGVANGSCSGFSATSRLMANSVIPHNAYDRADNGDGVHGVILPNGYLGLPPCNTNLPSLVCPPAPAAWTGFDLFRPFDAIDVWGRITSFQGAITSAEFINTLVGQFHRPIAFGARRGVAQGDPNLTLSRVRSNLRQTLIVLCGRDFEDMHTVIPYQILDEQGLQDDLLTPTPRTGFSLITIYDNNWPDQERFIEVDRAQNTFRYFLFTDVHGTRHINAGTGLFSMPLSVFRNARHALGPFDIAADLTNLLRVLHTGTTTTSISDQSGLNAGWTTTNLFNNYEGAVPFVPPGASPSSPQRFDSTQFFLPATNTPSAVNFVSRGEDVLLHYALGEGDFAYGFRAPNASANNSVYGILIGLNKSLVGMGLRSGAPVLGFSAAVTERDANHQSRVWLLDGGAGEVTPDLHLERQNSKTLKIRNHSPQPITYRIALMGVDGALGHFELSSDEITQPGDSTIVLRATETGANRGFQRELDSNNDGTPDQTEQLPARGALRATKESGLLALRWRALSENDTLLASSDVTAAAQPLSASITQEGTDRVTRLPMSAAKAFYQVQPAPSSCLSLASQNLGSRANAWSVGGFTFESINAAGGMNSQNTILKRSGSVGLDVPHTLRILPHNTCHTIDLEIRQTSGLVTVETLGPLGAVLSSEVLSGAGTGPQHVKLSNGRNPIHSVRVISPGGLCLISNLCAE